jgi:NDP-sugar pyrophosphorylase family protein
MITAVVMAGGKGTRLHPITAAIPKPLVPVGERPILDYVLRWLHHCGVRRVILAIGHLAEIITAVIGDGKRWGLNIEYSLEEKALGTIGPLRLIKNLPDNFLVLNGDILTDLDLHHFFRYHIENKALLTIATVKRKHQVDFGVLHFSEEDFTITRFEEKPLLEHSVSMGIYAMRREIRSLIPRNTPVGLDSLVEMLLKKHKAVKVFPYNGEWLDIGRLEDFIAANGDEKRALLHKILRA